jgi:hypothetical protein
VLGGATMREANVTGAGAWSAVIDGKPVGAGIPGPLTRQLQDLYWASHSDPRYSTPVRYDSPD